MGGTLKKGDALAVARIAGIMAAKKTVGPDPALPSDRAEPASRSTSLRRTAQIVITATAETTDRTGVEMEAMTAASVAALTLYDMAKAHRPRHAHLRRSNWSKSPAASPATSAAAMISVDEALDRIFTRIPTPLPETVPLSRAHRRVLLKPLLAKHTQPPFDASAMDGYAVRAAEIVPGQPLLLAGTSQAGAALRRHDGARQCVRIFTGAPLPIGADAVIMQEAGDRRRQPGQLRQRSRAPGQSIRRQGNDFTEGSELLPAGVGLTPDDAQPRRLGQLRRPRASPAGPSSPCSRPATNWCRPAARSAPTRSSRPTPTA